jgi:Mg-chelatase subunit ChlD
MGGEDKNTTALPVDAASTMDTTVDTAAEATATEATATATEATATSSQQPQDAQHAQQDTVVISAHAQYNKYSTNASDSNTACAHLVTAEADCDDDDSRSPLDLVAVIDVSGSMAGSKLSLAKDALRFVVKNLKPTDSLALVSYHSSVKTEFAFTKMDAAGKDRAYDVIGKLHTQGCTNLSGGLFEGIQHLQQRSTVEGRIGSVMLMTDGMANEGISDTRGLCDATRGLIGESPNFSIYTFGYGQNHNSDMLTNISEIGNGMYYFVENNDMIPESFAHCLGGLLTVQAQNLKLTITPQDGVSVTKVETDRTVTTQGTSSVVDMADLQAEEQKDVVFRFKLDKSVDEVSQRIVTVEIKYFDVKAATFKTASSELVIQRDSGDLSAQEPNELVQQQISRLEAASAMEEAMRLADAGRFAEAQSRMHRSHQVLSAQMDKFSTGLGAELQQCAQFMSASQYRSKGSHEVRTRWQSHAAQRDNITTFNDATPSAYATSSKAKMAYRSKGSR